MLKALRMSLSMPECSTSEISLFSRFRRAWSTAPKSSSGASGDATSLAPVPSVVAGSKRAVLPRSLERRRDDEEARQLWILWMGERLEGRLEGVTHPVYPGSVSLQ